MSLRLGGNDLTEPEQEEISAKVDLLEERGPAPIGEPNATADLGTAE